MSTNPYEKFLAGREPLTVIRETPARVAALAKQMGDAGLHRPFAPGKWTAAQILCHLADVDIAFSFRLRQAIAEPHHVINPFEQDDWAKPYQHLDPRLALASFIALRNWTVNFLYTVPKAEYAKPVTHPERGTMTFQGLLETMAGHDLNHLAQLQSIAGSK
jgi:hypothetical protein